jgi:hypothetical protein
MKILKSHFYRSVPRVKASRPYMLEDLIKAVKAITEESMSYQQASGRYNVPITTIKRYVKKPDTAFRKPGRQPALRTDEEAELVEIVTDVCNWHRFVGAFKAKLFQMIMEWVEEEVSKPEEHKSSLLLHWMKNERPGEGWYTKFLIRNPLIKIVYKRHCELKQLYL